MVKKILKETVKALLWIVLFAVVGLVVFLYNPKSVTTLNRDINSSSPYDTGGSRQELYERFDSFILDQATSTPFVGWFVVSKGRKLFELRSKGIVDEIASTVVPEGKIKVWYIYNMGVVAKTSKHIIAFDIAAPYLSFSFRGIGDLADIILTSHVHGDHYDTWVLKNGKNLVFPAGTYLAKSYKNKNLYELESGKKVNIDGASVTAFQTDHRRDQNFDFAVAWYLVEVDGFKLVHTGDGFNFKNMKERDFLYTQDIDILFANNQTAPFNIRDLSPKVVIPLHMHEIMHTKGYLETDGFGDVMSSFAKEAGSLKGITPYLLFWGESIEYSK